MAELKAGPEDLRMPFHVKDWAGDGPLGLCSLAAQGLWIRMLCYMWISPVRGLLLLNGQPMTVEQLAGLSLVTPGRAKDLLAELENHTIFSRNAAGTIYCRRLYKDHLKEGWIKKARQEAGKRGASARWADEDEPEPLPRATTKREVIKALYAYWQGLGVVVHRRLTDKMSRAISGKLGERYTATDIRKAMRVFAEIVNGPEYWWTHRWTLDMFLQRGFERFLDEEIAKANYRRGRKDETNESIRGDIKALGL